MHDEDKGTGEGDIHTRAKRGERKICMTPLERRRGGSMQDALEAGEEWETCMTMTEGEKWQTYITQSSYVNVFSFDEMI